MRTHYETLGLPTYATPAEIQVAYDEMVTADNDERRQAKIQDAYDTLIDPLARQMYDSLINAPKPDNPHAEPEYETIRGVPVKKNPRVKRLYIIAVVCAGAFAFGIQQYYNYFSKPAPAYTPQIFIDDATRKHLEELKAAKDSTDVVHAVK